MPGLDDRLRSKRPGMVCYRWMTGCEADTRRDQSIRSAHQVPLGIGWASRGYSVSLAHSSAVQTRIVAGNPLMSHRAELTISSPGRWRFRVLRFEAVFGARTASIIATFLMPVISSSSIDDSTTSRSFESGKPGSRTLIGLEKGRRTVFGDYEDFCRPSRRAVGGKVESLHTSEAKSPVEGVLAEGWVGMTEHRRIRREEERREKTSGNLLDRDRMNLKANRKSPRSKGTRDSPRFGSLW